MPLPQHAHYKAVEDDGTTVVQYQYRGWILIEVQEDGSLKISADWGGNHTEAHLAYGTTKAV